MKFISTLIILISIQAQGAGGVSGGGGNLISPVGPFIKQDPKEIKSIIDGSSSLLKKFVRAQYATYSTGGMDSESHGLYSHLFASKENNIHELIENVAIEVPLDKPCYDNSGNIFDGSFNSKNNSICISAYSIAKKCGKNEATYQAPALIFHELSELSGLSDDDATYLQKQALGTMKIIVQ